MLFPIRAIGLAALQSPRDSLRAGIDAYQQAQFDRAISLLAYGLNLAAGPPDSLRLASLYSLADALLQVGPGPLATTWLRWPSRHHTSRPLRVDKTRVPPIVSLGPGERAWVRGREVKFVWGYRLAPGSHLVTVSARGHVPWDTIIVAGLHERVELRVRLARQPDGPR